MRRTSVAVLLIGLLLFGGSVPAGGNAKEEAIKKDRKKYAGTWKGISLIVDGNEAPVEDANKIKVVNKADGTWTLYHDEKEVSKGTSVIDPTKKLKTIDLTTTEGNDKGKTALAIYEVDTNKRKLCLAPEGKDRPTDFASPSGSGLILITFERVK